MEFTFVTLHGDHGDRATLTEGFESVYTPPLIAFAERTVLRHRQRQLEDGMARTPDAIKRAAEQPGPPLSHNRP